MSNKSSEEGTCELVIYCYACKNHYQLNPDKIAIALTTNANLWEIYNYTLTTKCPNCKDKGIGE